MTSAARHAPATLRNREPLLDALRQTIPTQENVRVLEIAAGTGEHATYFAKHFSQVVWHPTDRDPEALESINAWRVESGSTNVQPATQLDVITGPWPTERFDLIVCVNMIHIAPWEACEALLAGTAQCLAPDGTLLTYGPYRFAGEHISESNRDFDAWLKSQDTQWGVRDTRDIEAAAKRHGLKIADIIAMPANNHSLLIRHA